MRCCYSIQAADVTTFVGSDDEVRSVWATSAISHVRWPPPPEGPRTVPISLTPSASTDEDGDIPDQPPSDDNEHEGGTPRWIRPQLAERPRPRGLPNGWRQELREARAHRAAYESWTMVSSMLGEGGQCSTCGGYFLGASCTGCYA